MATCGAFQPGKSGALLVPPPKPETALTVSFWEKYTGGGGCLLASGSDPAGMNTLRLAHGATRSLEAQMYGLGTARFEKTRLRIQKWNHHAIVFDKTGISWYVNGILIKPASTTSKTADGTQQVFQDSYSGTAGQELYLGNRKDLTCGGDGSSLFENLVLYNQALTSWDISVLFGHGRGFEPSPPPKPEVRRARLDPAVIEAADADGSDAMASQNNAPTPAPLWSAPDATVGARPGATKKTTHHELGNWDEAGSGFLRMRAGTTCAALKESLGVVGTPTECAELAREKGHKFFLYGGAPGASVATKGQCLGVKTMSLHCPETGGFTDSDDFDFYALSLGVHDEFGRYHHAIDRLKNLVPEAWEAGYKRGVSDALRVEGKSHYKGLTPPAPR